MWRAGLAIEHKKSRRWLPFFVIIALCIFGFIFFSHLGRVRSKPNVDSDQTLSLDQLNLPILPTELPTIPQLNNSSPTKETIQAGSAVLVDVDSGAILYAKQPERQVPIASTTKLMTAYLARQHLDLSKVVSITKEETSVIGSDIQLRPGETMTVQSLLAGLLLNSGNDAAMALADAAGGNRESFVTMMNDQAAKFGMTQTHYADPAGLDDDHGHSSAFDLSIIARVDMQDSVIAGLIKTKEMTIFSSDGRIRHDLKNSNRLVGEFDYPGAFGFKTGFTPAAGHCLVAGAARNGHKLIAVILHTDQETITASAIEARKLLDWGWANYHW